MSDSATLRVDDGGCYGNRFFRPEFAIDAGWWVATPINVGLPGWLLGPVAVKAEALVFIHDV